MIFFWQKYALSKIANFTVMNIKNLVLIFIENNEINEIV